MAAKQSSKNTAAHRQVAGVGKAPLGPARFDRVARRSGQLAFGILLTIVALSPLPFGSNTPECAMALAALCSLVLALAVLSRWPMKGMGIVRWSRATSVAAICFFGFGVCAVAQVVPGLPQVLRHPLWDESAGVLGMKLPPATISIDPELTYIALVKSGGNLAALMAASALVADPGRRRLAYTVLALSGACYAAYGILGLAWGDCCVLWLPKSAYFGVATGPFINRNSFATYLGLIALPCFGVVLRNWADLSRIGPGPMIRRMRTRLGLMFASCGLEVVVLIIVLCALLLTLSRGGITSFAVAGACLVLLLSRAGTFGRRLYLKHLAAFLIAVATVIGIFGSGLVNRFAAQGVEDVDRAQSWKIVITGIEASPWLGHGFGTFPEAFPLYRDDRLASRRYWDKAQNTYLELALDTGMPATILLLAGFSALAGQCFKGLSQHQSRRRIYPAIGLAALMLVALHSLVDFSMQIPAVAMTLFFVLGMSVAESGIWREPSSEHRAVAPAM